MQIIGWGYQLFLIANAMISSGQFELDVFKHPGLIENLVRIQLLQYLDVLFGIVGVTKTNIVFSIMQITARNFEI